MTEKLFWRDPYQVEFDATVTSILGEKIVLDKTCFFPRGGGQVGDTGTLDGVSVIDTREDEDTCLVHVLKTKPNFGVGGTVHGKIDWERRYMIMKLHSAAHIVFYIIPEVFGVDCKPASSGLLDDKKDRMDYFFSEKMDRDKLKVVEKKANQIIKKGYSIRTWTEKGQRYWKMDPFPEMRCGGTHVKNSSEIGKIEVKRGKKPGRGKERIEITLSSQKRSFQNIET